MNLKFESVGKIKDFPVSDIVGKFIVFKDDLEPQSSDFLNEFSYLQSHLTFGYVFPLKEEGLLVVKIARGFLDEDNLVNIQEIREIPKYKLLPQHDGLNTIKINDIGDCEFIFTDNLSSNLKEKYYDALPFFQDKKVELLYQNKSLDKFRDSNNPLIVNVSNFKVKLENSGDYGFVGTLLDGSNSKVLLKLVNNDLVIDNDFANGEDKANILEILSRLSGSASYNRKYLKNKFIDFKDNLDVSRVILGEYCKELDGIDKEIFSSRITKYYDEIIANCDYFIELSKTGNSKEALKLIEDYISNYSQDNQYIIEYLEKDIFTYFFRDDSFILRQDLSTIFKTYGVILNDNGYKEKSLEAFKHAYSFNPINVNNLIEIAIYYLDYDLNKCKDIIDLAFKYVYSVENFNELYHVLEEYYSCIGDFKKVEAVRQAINGDHELAYKLNIPTEFNLEILKLIMDKLESSIQNNNRQATEYYLNILINSKDCKIIEMSEGFKKFLELEYIDF